MTKPPNPPSPPDPPSPRVVPATPQALRAEIKRREAELKQLATPEARLERERWRWSQVLGSTSRYRVALSAADLPAYRAQVGAAFEALFEKDFLEYDHYTLDESTGFWVRTHPANPD